MFFIIINKMLCKTTVKQYFTLYLIQITVTQICITYLCVHFYSETAADLKCSFVFFRHCQH